MEAKKNCHQIQKMLAAYQDGEHDERARNLVEAHLRECSRCRVFYTEMEDIWQSFDELPKIETSAGFYRGVREKIDASRKHRFLQWARWTLQLFPAPAATFALLLIGVTLGAAMGNFMMTDSPLFERNSQAYTQSAMDTYSHGAFAPVPPGTMGDGYLRMASLTESFQK